MRRLPTAYAPIKRAENARSQARAARYAAMFPVPKQEPLRYVEVHHQNDALVDAKPAPCVTPFSGERL